MKQCSICGRADADTRPLGRQGSDVCLTCMDNPETRAVAADTLAAVVCATSLISPTGMVTIDGEEIRPMRPDDVWTEPQGRS